MPFPWARYWRRVGVVFVVALLVSVAAMLATGDGRLHGETILVAIVDSLALAVVLAFPLAQRIHRGPRH